MKLVQEEPAGEWVRKSGGRTVKTELAERIQNKMKDKGIPVTKPVDVRNIRAFEEKYRVQLACRFG